MWGQLTLEQTFTMHVHSDGPNSEATYTDCLAEGNDSLL